MMVHSWDTVLVVTKVVDNRTGRELFLDPGAWTKRDRWTKHADMCVQYAQCIKNNLVMDLESKCKENVRQEFPQTLFYWWFF